MNDTAKTVLVIAFVAVVLLFLLFGGGMATGAMMSGGMMGGGRMGGVAAIPRATRVTAKVVKPGACFKLRKANRRSCARFTAIGRCGRESFAIV